MYRKDYDDPLWYKPEILDKYDIDHRASRGTVLEQVEKASGNWMPIRRMTGKPDADMLFGKSAAQKAVPAQRRHPKAMQERPVCTSVEAEDRVSDGKGQERATYLEKQNLKKTRK